MKDPVESISLRNLTGRLSYGGFEATEKPGGLFLTVADLTVCVSASRAEAAVASLATLAARVELAHVGRSSKRLVNIEAKLTYNIPASTVQHDSTAFASRPGLTDYTGQVWTVASYLNLAAEDRVAA